MKKFLLTCVLVLVCGCDSNDVGYQSRMCCDPADDKERAAWVLTCIEKGNPFSDGEPEDLVAECSARSFHQFCRSIRGTMNYQTRVFTPDTDQPACPSEHVR